MSFLGGEDQCMRDGNAEEGGVKQWAVTEHNAPSQGAQQNSMEERALAIQHP